MAKLTIAGREYDIAPYKLGDLRKAAPAIDRINATAGAITTIEGMAESSADLLAVLSIGLRKINDTLTPEYLEEIVGFDELPAISAAFSDLLAESGFKPAGEAKAPSASPEEAEGASSSSSESSSMSSSQPA